MDIKQFLKLSEKKLLSDFDYDNFNLLLFGFSKYNEQVFFKFLFNA